MATVLKWIRNHDESWLFVAIYIGFAVVLSVMLSLFWLVLMVGIHLLFEVIRHAREYEGWGQVLSRATWEIRVDVALLLLAFAVTLYMDLIVAILGLQSLGRAAVATSRVGTRAVVWQRAVRAVVLGFDDVANGIRAILMKRGKASSPAGAPAAAGAPAPPAESTGAAPDPPRASPPAGLPGWGQGWGFWDRMTMALCAACLMAMLAAPPLTGNSYLQGAQMLREELRPFPPADEEQEPGALPAAEASSLSGSEEGMPVGE